MRTFIPTLACSCLLAGSAVSALAQAAPAEPAAVPATPPVAPAAVPAPVEQPPQAPVTAPAAPPAPKAAPRIQVVRSAPAPGATGKDDATLRLNFRNAPLETVLNYLSEAAGYTIVLEAPLRGTVDVWNNQPLTKAEALEVLNSALSKNGLTALQNGRTLTILSKDEAKKRTMPVKQGSDPDLIPKNEEIVTQIMPVSHISAAQLIRDLSPLIPTTATITSNEGGNAIIITDTQSNIKHLAEIVKAIDTSISSVAGIKVFMLSFADSKTVTQMIKDLFASDGGSRGGSSSGGFDPRALIASRFGGGGPGGPGGPGGFGGFGGGGDSGSSRSSSSRGPVAARVTAVADERSNSVIVTAPDDVMPTIEELVKAVDQNVEDAMEIRVFRLHYADPTEMAELLSNLFPDETQSRNSNNQSSRFGSPFGGPGGPGGDQNRSRSSSSSNQSERAKKQGRVLAVPDPRTSSVVVSTSKDLMVEVSKMVEQLDNDPARKQKVYTYSLQNADAQQVQQILQELFQSQQNSRNQRSGSQQNSPLTTRSSTQSRNGTTTGNSGFGGGNTGGGGGNTGGGGGGFGGR